MTQANSPQRRGFLKASASTVAAGVAAAASVAAPTAALAQNNVTKGAGKGARIASPQMAKGMKLLSFRRGNQYALGVQTAKGVLDVAAAAKMFKVTTPSSTDDVIQNGDQGLSALVAKAVASSNAALFLDENKIEYGPCVTNPEKIVCVGLNYAKHARETNNPIPKLPILFNKFNSTLSGHKGQIRVSAVPATNFDYEAELVIIMGRRAANVSEAEALSYVFGYATGNDFTARDLQSRSSQWMIGKNSDGFGPVGPYAVCADLVGDAGQLKIECLVNGEVRQSSNTSDLVFNCAQIVSYTSKLFTLEAGDIIFTGTPEGVISGYPKDKQVWLKPGDKLVTRIEKLGDLAFTLV
jgi:2-keto-4-pentenoate hydratase/2-oxohepta-3-ene-1,7-dioic acid hydratase in catechol pathway